MKVVYHRGALRDLGSIYAHIAEDDPDAADKVIARIRSVIDHLSRSPYLGRAGRRGARLLSIAGLPYVVIYRIHDGSVQIVAIFHTARNRQF
jgi:toxin ParE1/3/4